MIPAREDLDAAAAATARQTLAAAMTGDEALDQAAALGIIRPHLRARDSELAAVTRAVADEFTLRHG